jgi:Fe-S oxidoreductase
MEERKRVAPHDQSSRTNAFFRNLLTLNQAFAQEPFRDSHADLGDDRAVLWLGCNVLRTPHLADLASRIMRMLNPRLSILGGPSHCCGSPMTEKEERERALNRTLGHFQAEKAPTLVSWCPSCHTNLRKGSDASTWGFDELHVTEFIARRLERLELKNHVSARVMLHGHTGTPDRDRDMTYCRKLLEAIPGISLVAEHSDSELGLHCVPILMPPHVGAEGFESKAAALLEQARKAGVDMLVTIYHSCYRELEKRRDTSSPVVENYITLLARALGLQVPQNVYREIAQGGENRLAQLRCEAQARGIDEEDLQRAIKAEFPPRP